MLAYTV